MATCWICHEDTPELVAACDCTGELSVSHFACLTEWAQRQSHCRMCNTRYRVPFSPLSYYIPSAFLWSTTCIFVFWLRWASLPWYTHIFWSFAIWLYVAMFGVLSNHIPDAFLKEHYLRAIPFVLGSTSCLPLVLSNRWLPNDLVRAWFLLGAVFGSLVRVLALLLS